MTEGMGGLLTGQLVGGSENNEDLFVGGSRHDGDG